MMRFGRRVETVDRIGRERHRRVEAEAVRRAAEAENARDVARREDARAVELEQAVVAVLEAEAADAAVPGSFDDRAYDCVEAGSVAAAREDADALDRSHGATTIAKRAGVA